MSPWDPFYAWAMWIKTFFKKFKSPVHKIRPYMLTKNGSSYDQMIIYFMEDYHSIPSNSCLSPIFWYFSSSLLCDKWEAMALRSTPPPTNLYHSIKLPIFHTPSLRSWKPVFCAILWFPVWDPAGLSFVPVDTVDCNNENVVQDKVSSFTMTNGKNCFS